jgi:hypothetical protein
MSIKNNHIVVLFCYNNVDHIIKCYNSLKNNDIDFFVVENYSDNSSLIEEFFKNETIIGHILFKENIVNNAIEIFIKNYFELLKCYSLITITDCDLLSDNPDSLFQEIYSILEDDDIGVCCSKLCLKNLPNVPGSDRWVPKEKKINEKYIETKSGIHMMTLTQKNLNLIKDVKFLDQNLIKIFEENNLKWVTTIKNDVVHLTWDLYYHNNDYYNFKVKNRTTLWTSNKVCEYNILK